MSATTPVPQAAPAGTTHHRLGTMVRSIVIGLIAFFTVVDLFATQALLPTLTRIYGTTPAAMSVAVNASTIGMAVAGLAVALFSRHIDRRRGYPTQSRAALDPHGAAGCRA